MVDYYNGGKVEEARIAMTFKFCLDTKALLQRLAGMDDRSMTNYLEQLIRREADTNGITNKSIKNNGRKRCP
jgi:hypothetical protein